MTVAWIGVGAAVLGAGASYAGAKKQSDAAKQAANTNLGMFQTLNAQQQPYMQSGYGALAKLNTLLGIGGGGGRPMPVGGGGSMYRPSAGGGVRMQAALGPPSSPAHNYGGGGGYPDLKLRQILQLRAMQGDPQAISQLQQGGG